MSRDDCIKTLRRHNNWRRGDDSVMLSPQEIGQCIDQSIAEVARLRELESLVKKMLSARSMVARDAAVQRIEAWAGRGCEQKD